MFAQATEGEMNFMCRQFEERKGKENVVVVVIGKELIKIKRDFLEDLRIYNSMRRENLTLANWLIIIIPDLTI